MVFLCDFLETCSFQYPFPEQQIDLVYVEQHEAPPLHEEFFLLYCNHVRASLWPPRFSMRSCHGRLLWNLPDPPRLWFLQVSAACCYCHLGVTSLMKTAWVCSLCDYCPNAIGFLAPYCGGGRQRQRKQVAFVLVLARTWENCSLFLFRSQLLCMWNEISAQHQWW